MQAYEASAGSATGRSGRRLPLQADRRLISIKVQPGCLTQTWQGIMSELIDNRAQRVRTLKEIILDLHRGVSPDEVKARLKELVRQTDSTEIAAMEQELMADGMPAHEVQAMCDTHAAVLREITVEEQVVEVPPGHPVDTFRRENEALLAATGAIRQALRRLSERDDEASAEDVREQVLARFGELMDVDKHYQRKENLVFSFLERHFITGPSKVMWGKDDEVRELLRGVEAVLQTEAPSAGELAVAAQAVIEPALAAVDSMVEKESRVLLPLTRQRLTEREWGEVWVQSPEYGWCIVEPQEGYVPPASVAPRKRAKVAGDEAVVFPTGALTPDQVRGLLQVLPVDVTFVDADDRVRYFSEGPARIFARSRAILGRKVQHCHPPSSVGVVEQILSDFRAGRQDVAEFWIQLHGRFVHIRYFAVRDESRAYLGTLEVTQDLTPLRALQGEQRLLQYREGPGGSEQ
jgi:DUF438 domain-containing protein